MHENCIFYMLALSSSVVTFVAFIKVVFLVNLVILHHILTRKSFYDLVRFEILRCNHVLWFCTLIVLEAVSIVVLLLRRRHVYSVTVVVYLLEGRFCIESSPHSLRSFTFFIVQKLFLRVIYLLPGGFWPYLAFAYENEDFTVYIHESGCYGYVIALRDCYFHVEYLFCVICISENFQ